MIVAAVRRVSCGVQGPPLRHSAPVALLRLADDGRLHTCKARGILRKKGLKPVAGDRVVLGLEADTETALGVLMQVWDALRSAGYSVNDVPARIQRAQP